jgi:hypothetical protein
MTNRKRRTPIESDDLYAPEYPEDTVSRRESSEQARQAVEAFGDAHHDELLALLWTYGDKYAQEKLEALREKFWVGLPFPPKGPSDE